MIVTRRSVLRGLIAAPLVVAAPSLMRLPRRPLVAFLDQSEGFVPANTWKVVGLDQWGLGVVEYLKVPAYYGELVGASRGSWRTVTSIQVA